MLPPGARMTPSTWLPLAWPTWFGEHPMMSTPLLRIEHLAKHFGERRALVDLSLELAGGEILGLLGPNGAGKTTTMRVLLGLLVPTTGVATVCDLDTVRD